MRLNAIETKHLPEWPISTSRGLEWNETNWDFQFSRDQDGTLRDRSRPWEKMGIFHTVVITTN